MHNAKDIFRSILDPQDYDSFFDDYVSQKPLALLDEDHDARKSILGNDPKQTILNSYAQFAPTLTCHAHAPVKPPPVPHAVTGVSEFHELIGEYHAGDYTVRIPKVDALTFELQQYLRAIEALLFVPADAAIFWSHAGAAAPVHHDEYDIIAIQLVGKKKWFISKDEPTLPNQWAKVGESPPTLQNFQIIDVAPGDFLYLPRGTAHTVQSTTESIHLSIGFVPITQRDIMIAVLDHWSDLDRPLRNNANIRADQHPVTDPAMLQESINSSIEKLSDQCTSSQFLASAMEHHKARTIFKLSKLARNLDSAKLTLGSKMRHHPLATAHIATTDEIVDFTIPGEHILVHKGAEQALRFIANSPEFQVGEIADDLEEDVRIALAQKLYDSGYLELVS